MDKMITKIVIRALKNLKSYMDVEGLECPNENTKIYGKYGVLDSLALVNLVVDIESSIRKRLGKNIILADKWALIQKNSPFRTVRSLCNFIVRILHEKAINE